MLSKESELYEKEKETLDFVLLEKDVSSKIAQAIAWNRGRGWKQIYLYYNRIAHLEQFDAHRVHPNDFYN